MEDRNRITGGGITSGIDFGLNIVARLRDEASAQRTKLILEYAPDPPFQAGTPESAPVPVLEGLLDALAPFVASAKEAAAQAKARLAHGVRFRRKGPLRRVQVSRRRDRRDGQEGV